MAVSQVVALRGPGGLALLPPTGWLWPGFRTTCRLAGASPWRGSKEARAPASSFGIRRARYGSFAIPRKEGVSDGGSTAAAAPGRRTGRGDTVGDIDERRRILRQRRKVTAAVRNHLADISGRSARGRGRKGHDDQPRRVGVRLASVEEETGLRSLSVTDAVTGLRELSGYPPPTGARRDWPWKVGIQQGRIRLAPSRTTLPAHTLHRNPASRVR
jgi:hypothetical protein